MFLEFRPLIIKSATYGSRVGADVRSADEIGISIQPELSQSSSSSGQLNFDRNHRARSGWSGSCRTLFSAFPHFPSVAARATPKRASSSTGVACTLELALVRALGVSILRAQHFPYLACESIRSKWLVDVG